MARSQRFGDEADPLTGLPDRRSLDVMLADAIDRSRESGGCVAAVVIDLAELMAVNQMFGRDETDEVVRSVSERLVEQLADDDLALRLGGGEFAVIRMVGAGRDAFDELDAFAVALVTAMSEPFELRTYTVTVGANVGIALCRPDGADGTDDVASVMRRADVALYRSKLGGQNRYEIHEQAIHDQVSPAVIVDWLRAALDDHQLRLAYQPIYDIAGDSLVAVEALLRWEHPTEGALLPNVVLPALEDSGLIVEVGEWVFDEACRQARHWRETVGSGTPPTVFVNVSPRQLMSPRFLPVLEAALTEHGIDPSQICMELGALSTVPPASPIWMLLREARALGVRLALDNFGDNDSSYGLIRRLQIDYLKIGRRLTNARHATPHDDAIARSIVALAAALGVTTVAEGVEDPSSLERARSLGCGLGQGFYFGTAETPEAVDQRIASGRLLRPAVFH